MENVINLVNYKGSELVIREGKASDPINPVNVLIEGNIDSPLWWLKKKLSVINIVLCHLLVDREKGVMSLYVDDKGPATDCIKGRLDLHPDFVKFGINTGAQIDSHTLAEKIKMYRSCFKDKSTAMKLVSDLRNFTAKINKELEAIKDDRANYSLKKSQIVDTNLPDSFILVVPVFKGEKKQEIKIEINIDANTLNCSLISPDANDYISEFKDSIIDEQIEKILAIQPGLTIIEI